MGPDDNIFSCLPVLREELNSQKVQFDRVFWAVRSQTKDWKYGQYFFDADFVGQVIVVTKVSM
jgi:hypothetical protein